MTTTSTSTSRAPASSTAVADEDADDGDDDDSSWQGHGTLVPPDGLQDPPWETRSEVSATGINAGFVASFEQSEANKDGCRPMGIDTAVWTPGEEQQGFVFHMATMDGSALYRPGDAYFTDGSVMSLVTWEDEPDDPQHLYLYVPTDDPSIYCTYVYGPIGPTNPLETVVDSLRWIEGG